MTTLVAQPGVSPVGLRRSWVPWQYIDLKPEIGCGRRARFTYMSMGIYRCDVCGSCDVGASTFYHDLKCKGHQQPWRCWLLREVN